MCMECYIPFRETGCACLQEEGSKIKHLANDDCCQCARREEGKVIAGAHKCCITAYKDVITIIHTSTLLYCYPIMYTELFITACRGREEGKVIAGAHKCIMQSNFFA